MSPSHIGRLPVTVVLNELDEKALINILTKPKNAIIKQYQALLGMDGVELTFEEDALKEIARIAQENKTGARGLRAIFETAMTDIMLHAPAGDVKEITVTKEMIADIKKAAA